MQSCGAKNKRGGVCKAKPMANGRCRMHGGKSLAWFAHPRYKHGRYSKYSASAREEAQARASRKRARFLLAVSRKVERWAEARGGVSYAELDAAFRCFEVEHEGELERRRAAYKRSHPKGISR
jgi:hypothetical protein